MKMNFRLIYIFLILFFISTKILADNHIPKKHTDSCYFDISCMLESSEEIEAYDYLQINSQPFHQNRQGHSNSNSNKHEGGHTILNGNDSGSAINGGDLIPVLKDVREFKTFIISKIRELSDDCLQNYSFSRKELIEKIEAFKTEVIDENNQIYIFFDQNNYINKKIIVDGKTRTAANIPDLNTIYIDRNLWIQNHRKNSLLMHELFGLMGIEKTDNYELSSQFLFILTAGQCKAKNQPTASPKIKRGCQNRSINYSNYKIQTSSYDKINHIYSFFDSQDKCFYFWDAKNNKRLEKYDIEINFSIKNFILHNGHLILLPNSQNIMSFPYNEFETPLKLYNRFKASADNTVKGLFPFGDHLLISFDNFDGHYALNLQPLKTILRDATDPIVQTLPFMPLKNNPNSTPEIPSNHNIIIRESGLVEYFYLINNEDSAQFHQNPLIKLEQSELKFPFVLIFNSELINKEQVKISLVGNDNTLMDKPLTLDQAAGFSHYLTINKLDPDNIEAYQQAYEVLGDRVYDIYSEIKLLDIFYEHNHITHSNILVSSSKFLNVIYDDQADFYFLIGQTDVKNEDSLNFVKVESGQETLYCNFHLSRCQFSSELNP